MIGLAMNLAVVGFVGFEYLQTREMFLYRAGDLDILRSLPGKFLRATFGQSDKGLTWKRRTLCSSY